jgi:hypothetical protein
MDQCESAEEKHSVRRRLGVLTERNLRRFFVGYATSLLGSSMAGLAVTFAVLRDGRTSSELGYVLAARIVPIVVFLLCGGVIADRLSARRVMLAADALRCLTQGVFAVVLFVGRPPLWAMVVLVAVWGMGEGFFMPSLGALIPRLARDGTKLQDANALIGIARSATDVAGPALASVAVAVAGSASVLAFDAATYAVSVTALSLLRISDPEPTGAAPAAGARRSMLADLREGWSEFSSRTWLWVTTVQFALFNMAVWAPFLVLGPVVAVQRLGGTQAWGLIMALYGGGAVFGGLAIIGRVPGRPLVVATIATFAFALPPAALAAGLPTGWVAAAALLAGMGSAVHGAVDDTTIQREVPLTALARVNAYMIVGAFGLGPLGLAAAGPVAAATGTTALLWFGAAWQAATCLLVLALPAVRHLRTPAPGVPAREM